MQHHHRQIHPDHLVHQSQVDPPEGEGQHEGAADAEKREQEDRHPRYSVVQHTEHRAEQDVAVPAGISVVKEDHDSGDYDYRQAKRVQQGSQDEDTARERARLRAQEVAHREDVAGQPDNQTEQVEGDEGAVC